MHQSVSIITINLSKTGQAVVEHYAKLSEPLESNRSNNCAPLQYLGVMTGYQ